MARIRSLHPNQWTDEAFVTCSPMARLLAIALRNEADDGGVFAWKPLTLKMRLLPADSVDINLLLEELAGADIIRRYEIDGVHYGAIRNFTLFQKPKFPKTYHPRLPWVPKYCGMKGSGIPEPSGSPPAALPEDSGNAPEIAPQMESESESEKERDSSAAQTGLSHRDEDQATCRRGRAGAASQDAAAFERFWQAYPRHIGKGQARRAFAAARRKAEPEAIMAGLAAAAARWRQDNTATEYIPHPATWLNGERWSDEHAPPPAKAGNGQDADRFAEAAREQRLRRQCRAEGFTDHSPEFYDRMVELRAQESEHHG